MPDEISAGAIVRDGGRRSIKVGDVPEAVRRRYYLDGKGGPGVGFFVDARVQVAAFRDRGAQLVAPRASPHAIRDMTAIAQHRGWTAVVVRGDPDFRREAWLAAMSVGIDAKGYRATERDLQELARRQAAQQRKAVRDAGPAPVGDPENDEAARANLRVVEAVVRARVASQPAQQRILAAAAERLAHWLERGARVQPISTVRTPDPEQHGVRERQRSR